jgi:hypothetical protein
MNDLFCVIAGDPISGLTVYGPFTKGVDATEWAIDNIAHDLNFWVTELKSDITMESYR